MAEALIKFTKCWNSYHAKVSFDKENHRNESAAALKVFLLLSQHLVHSALGDQSGNVFWRRGLGLGNQRGAKHPTTKIFNGWENTCDKFLNLTCDSSSSPCCGTVCRIRRTGGSWRCDISRGSSGCKPCWSSGHTNDNQKPLQSPWSGKIIYQLLSVLYFKKLLVAVVSFHVPWMTFSCL